jgi:microsomal dipeptidase-like Zn-dependent dipeptidase
VVGADHVGLGSDFDGAFCAVWDGRLFKAAENYRSPDAQGILR